MIIKCYNGEKVDRRQARKIKGKYYVPNKHCFKINGLWRRIDDPRIVYNTDRKMWILLEDTEPANMYVRGINADGEMLYAVGTTIPNGNRHCIIDGKITYAPYELVEDFYYEAKTDVYYKDKDDAELAKEVTLFYSKLEYNFSKVYGFFVGRKFDTSGRFGLESPFTIGIELETNDGRVQIPELVKYGICPLRDGSINGYEYTSFPTKSYNQIIGIANAVNSKCSINNNCSMHIHFGGFKIDEELVVKMYHTFYKLQNEIYSYFPPYKKNDVTGVKRRNYTAKLSNYSTTKTDEYFNRILNYLAGTNSISYKGEVMKHPNDPNGSHKWHIDSRYNYVNFINLLFSESRTFETRIHEGTLNPYKIVYWALINEAILMYVLSNSFNTIYKDFYGSNQITLDKILKKYAQKGTYDALSSYLKERYTWFQQSEHSPEFLNVIRNDKKYVPKIKLF